MDDTDRDYFRDRAEAEIRAAAETENPAACQAHYELAEAYLDRAYAGSEAVEDDTAAA